MTTHRALADCRAALHRQIEILEHELGIEAAFPVTIGLLRLAQDLTRRILHCESSVPICAEATQREALAGLPKGVTRV